MRIRFNQHFKWSTDIAKLTPADWLTMSYKLFVPIRDSKDEANKQGRDLIHEEYLKAFTKYDFEKYWDGLQKLKFLLIDKKP